MSLSLFFSHTHTLTLFFTHTRVHAHTHTLSLSHTHTHTHTHTHAHTHFASYGCGAVAAAGVAGPPEAATGFNVAGAMVATVLMIVTSAWIRHASIANQQAAQMPARIMCVTTALSCCTDCARAPGRCEHH
jgi:hypothetical protein